ncbi:hypothetical protein [Virgibacillus proomii]|jgi:allantoate deiminase|nr:hypothetical protein [Virgibacillus proomii]
MININRLTNHLREKAAIGKTKNGRINRFSYTDEKRCEKTINNTWRL